MNLAVLALVLVDFALIGLLPKIFFKRGRYGFVWWLTSSPLLVGGFVPLLAAFGLVPVVALPEVARVVADVLAALAAAGSLALLCATLATHERRLAAFHQEDDSPAHVVTHGPYARVRHPFYAGFLLALVGAVALAPGVLSALSLVGGVVAFHVTATREERRFMASAFAREYGAYMAGTRRFLPRLGGRPS
jgi:protein-S-isoprenylcysteine O-methyltransferase Ste14